MKKQKVKHQTYAVKLKGILNNQNSSTAEKNESKMRTLLLGQNFQYHRDL